MSRKQGAPNQRAEIVRLTFVLGGDGREVPTEFRIFAAGANPTDKGTFVFDDEAARSVMSAYAAKNVPLMMDYEHMALSDPPVVAPASCSSWVPEVRGGELWATACKWTARALEMMKAGEYRLFSPAFVHDPKTMRVMRMINIALTNTPAMVGIAPLVAATSTDTDRERTTAMKPMKCKECKATLRTPTDDDDGDEAYCTTCKSGFGKMLSIVGLKASTSDAEIAATLSALDVARTTIITLTGAADLPRALTAVQGLIALRAEARKLTGQDGEPAIIAALTTMKGAADRVVALEAAQKEAGAKALRLELSQIWDSATEAGKLPPALRAEREAQVLSWTGGVVTAQTVEAAKVLVEGMGVKVGTAATKQKATGSVVLTAEDIHIAKLMGNKLEDVEKYKLEQLQLQQTGQGA